VTAAGPGRGRSVSGLCGRCSGYSMTRSRRSSVGCGRPRGGAFDAAARPTRTLRGVAMAAAAGPGGHPRRTASTAPSHGYRCLRRTTSHPAVAFRVSRPWGAAMAETAREQILRAVESITNVDSGPSLQGHTRGTPAAKHWARGVDHPDTRCLSDARELAGQLRDYIRRVRPDRPRRVPLADVENAHDA